MLNTLIGLVLTLGSLTVKTPIIRNVIAANSGEGVPTISVGLEILSQTLYLSFFVISRESMFLYSEVISVYLQNLALAVVLAYYMKTPLSTFIGYVARLGLLWMALFLAPRAFLPFYAPVSSLINWTSILPILASNFTSKKTGVLSLFSQMQVCIGSCLRSYTIITSLPFLSNIIPSLIGTSLQLILGAQLIYYNHLLDNPSVQKIVTIASDVSTNLVADRLPEMSLQDVQGNLAPFLDNVASFTETVDINAELKKLLPETLKTKSFRAVVDEAAQWKVRVD